MKDFAPGKSVAARQSGDEFILFLYQYQEKDELLRDLKAFESIRDHCDVELGNALRVPLKFSIGYCLTEDAVDYSSLIKKADSEMYSNKRERKAKIQEEPKDDGISSDK